MADPPKRHPSRPELPSIVTPDQPERAAVRHHPGVEGQPQQPPKRTTLTDLPKAQPPAPKATLSGFPAPPPALPLEYAPTKRPPLPWGKTVRAESLPEVVAAARRTDPPAAPTPPPTSVRVPPEETRATGRLPPPSLDPESATVDALRRRAEAAEARRDELERRERVRAESQSPGGWPPKVERRQSPVPSSGPEEGKVDRAVGHTVRLLLARYGWPALAALGIGGAALKPTADPAKAEATLANTEAMRSDIGLIREQLAGVLKREAARDAYIRCLEESLDEVGSQVLPAVDHAGAAQPLRAYVSRCQRLRP